jgi:hypothetical protein
MSVVRGGADSLRPAARSGRATRNVNALAEARISEVLRWPLDSTETCHSVGAAPATLITTVTRFPLPEILP